MYMYYYVIGTPQIQKNRLFMKIKNNLFIFMYRHYIVFNCIIDLYEFSVIILL